MAALRADEVAFGSPGGEMCRAAEKRPVDLVHLARQTLGDRDLEQEILKMFVHQMAEISVKLEASKGEERKRLAHQLKGSARGVGAFGVANCASEIEKDPGKPALIRALNRQIREVRVYLASINR